MDWGQFILMLIAIIGLFAWNRVEACSDRREANSLREADRRDVLTLLEAIKNEIKDFHGRLCAIEERNKK
jgi:hypothetical protein